MTNTDPQKRSAGGVLIAEGPLTQAQADAVEAESEKFFAGYLADGTYTVAGVEVTYRRLEHDENCWIACPHDRPPETSR